jgi:hypothetical protein
MNESNGNAQHAKRLLKHYLRHAIEGSGGHWDGDNAAEVDDLVDSIIKAAADAGAAQALRAIPSHMLE